MHVEHELICWIFRFNSLSLVSRGHFSTHMTLKKAFKKEEKQKKIWVLMKMLQFIKKNVECGYKSIVLSQSTHMMKSG